ncbi:MAG: hypothetical protein BWY71_01816 [Planctomycetes bacterium ADurb.Bin412]|nr:MAG: hypothetical protein BWY71_01816 [Planctomycetes bacterium ADurb.Bin412]
MGQGFQILALIIQQVRAVRHQLFRPQHQCSQYGKGRRKNHHQGKAGNGVHLCRSQPQPRRVILSRGRFRQFRCAGLPQVAPAPAFFPDPGYIGQVIVAGPPDGGNINHNLQPGRTLLQIRQFFQGPFRIGQLMRQNQILDQIPPIRTQIEQGRQNGG